MATLCLYCDGGVIRKNPSPYGGTWAFVLVVNDITVMNKDKGVMFPAIFQQHFITNNQSEMYALLRGLAFLPPDLREITIASDSYVTLGRAFHGFKWANIPQSMHEMYQNERARLIHWDTFHPVLLDGHPTQAQLQAGIGKRGGPVSRWNVMCDQMCREAGEEHKPHES